MAVPLIFVDVHIFVIAFSICTPRQLAKHTRVFRPKPHSGRSANLVLNDKREKKSFLQ